MKRTISMLLCVLMLMGTLTSVFAYDGGVIAAGEMSEYDMIIAERDQETNQTYSPNGMNSQAVQIETETIEYKLLERAQLSEEDLADIYGYTDEQIAILKDYDGSPLEENPQLRAVMATFSYTVVVETAMIKECIVRFIWEWNNGVPFDVYTDKVACQWTCSDNRDVTANYSSTNSRCELNYYERARPTIAYGTYTSAVTAIFTQGAEASVPMTRGVQGIYFCKSGYLRVRYTTGLPMKESKVSFAYGHSTINASPSVGIPKSLSFSWSSGVQEMTSPANKVYLIEIVE